MVGGCREEAWRAAETRASPEAAGSAGRTDPVRGCRPADVSGRANGGAAGRAADVAARAEWHASPRCAARRARRMPTGLSGPNCNLSGCGRGSLEGDYISSIARACASSLLLCLPQASWLWIWRRASTACCRRSRPADWVCIWRAIR